MVQKVAIAGSLKWDDRLKIKDFIYGIKRKFGAELEIVGGGLKDGADNICKKFCLEFNIEFSETPPHDYPWNNFCSEPAYMYGKSYNSKNIYIRNENLSKECSFLVMFRLKDDTSPFLDDLIARFDKKNKKILIIN